MRQKLQFLSAGTVRAEFELETEQDTISLVAIYHPAQDPDVSAYQTVEEVADAIEDRVTEHFGDNPVRRIISQHGEIVGIRELGRYAAPVSFQNPQNSG